MQDIGPIGGWKVGAKGPDREPNCAPLPAAGILTSLAALGDGAWRVRGIETELAVRLERDLAPRDRPYGRDEVLSAIGALVPAIEVVETRLIEFPAADPVASLADLNSHGALVVGDPVTPGPDALDGARIEAQLWFGEREVAATRGGNPAVDLGRLLVWLANHCSQRGHGLQRGQVVTLGSCTGMLFAPAGCRVRGTLAGIGAVELAFTPAA
jgi:2-keto-4-pentenoate hydratase